MNMIAMPLHATGLPPCNVALPGSALLLEAIDKLPVGVGVETADGELTHCNQAFTAYYRVSASTLIGMPFMDRMRIICPHIVEVNGQRVHGEGPLAAFECDPCMHHDAPGSIETRLRDGRSFLNERVDLGDGGRVIVMTDVTALKRAETEIEARQDRATRYHQNPERSADLANLQPLQARYPAAVEQASDNRVALGACQLDLSAARLYGPDGEEMPITAMEFRLLRVFADNRGRILSRDQLLEEAHDRGWEPFDRSIDLRISRIRHKIEINPAKPQIIRTVRGLGYILD